MLAEPNCRKRRCVHFLRAKTDKGGIELNERWICKAFLDGIPKEIAFGSNDHTKPFEGDNGIQFEEASPK